MVLLEKNMDVFANYIVTINILVEITFVPNYQDLEIEKVPRSIRGEKSSKDMALLVGWLF